MQQDTSVDYLYLHASPQSIQQLLLAGTGSGNHDRITRVEAGQSGGQLGDLVPPARADSSAEMISSERLNRLGSNRI